MVVMQDGATVSSGQELSHFRGPAWLNSHRESDSASHFDRHFLIEAVWSLSGLTSCVNHAHNSILFAPVLGLKPLQREVAGAHDGRDGAESARFPRDGIAALANVGNDLAVVGD